MAEEKVKEKKQSALQKQGNCLGCGKPIKKIRRYYRDGKFYCTKRCRRDHLKKTKEEKKE